jgi:deazaflavin-dependent oxidoreductase (nitroreductase family)
VLHHTGRRSGRAYATPVVARPVADGFVIPMPFGDETQWARNLLAAGQGVLHWNCAEHPVVEPRVIEWEEARPAFNRLQGAIIGRIGSRRFVRVRRA